MIYLENNILKEKLKNNLINNNKNVSILVISQSRDKEVMQYKNTIEKQCDKYNIEFIGVNCHENESEISVTNRINRSTANSFILLQPLNSNTNINYLRKNIDNTIIDLDCMTYQSLGKLMSNNFTNLPCTAQSIIQLLEFNNIDLKSKNIVIANSTNIIGKPLALYLNFENATVTLLNSKSINQKQIIKNCDIFITAIGKANYYNIDYFKENQYIIDAGMEFKNSKLYGDIDYNSIKNLNVNILGYNKDIGQLTTLNLLNKLIGEK